MFHVALLIFCLVLYKLGMTGNISVFVYYLSIFILLLALFLFRVWFRETLKKNHKKVNTLYLLLIEELNPEKLINNITVFLESSKMFTDATTHGRIALGAGYSDAGDFNKALKTYEEILNQLKNITIRQRKWLMKEVYFSLAKLYIYNSDLEKGLNYYRLSNAIKLPNFEEKYQVSINQLEATIDLLENRTNESLTKFLRFLSEAESEYRKVNVHFQLAQVYEKLSDIEKQKEHLHYVVENGNKLHIATQAREILASLG